jgi:hypothetical protein
MSISDDVDSSLYVTGFVPQNVVLEVQLFRRRIISDDGRMGIASIHKMSILIQHQQSWRISFNNHDLLQVVSRGSLGDNSR